jgi:hypothetical protein
VSTFYIFFPKNHNKKTGGLKMNFVRLFILSITLIFAGCASNPMQVVSNQALPQTTNDKAQVVFVRSSFLGNAINASIYDVTSGEPIFIGVIANETKIAYPTNAGKHLFMVVSEAADFLEAEVVAGKSYYSIITPRMGFWKARFSMWPVKNDGSTKYNTASKEFQKILISTKLVENSEKSNAWFKKHQQDIRSKYLEYLPVWQQKSAEDLAKRTLLKSDGK